MSLTQMVSGWLQEMETILFAIPWKTRRLREVGCRLQTRYYSERTAILSPTAMERGLRVEMQVERYSHTLPHASPTAVAGCH